MVLAASTHRKAECPLVACSRTAQMTPCLHVAPIDTNSLAIAQDLASRTMTTDDSDTALFYAAEQASNHVIRPVY